MRTFRWVERRNCTQLLVSDDENETGWPVAYVADVPGGWSFDCGVTENSIYQLDCPPINFGTERYSLLSNAIHFAEEFIRGHLSRKDAVQEG